MAERDEAPNSENNPSEIRRKLIKRLAVAGALVASLLGMLAFFDYLATAPEEPEAPVFTRPVPVVAKKEVSQPVTPATNLPEPPSLAAPEPVVVGPSAATPTAPALEAQPSAIVPVKPEATSENRPFPPSTAAKAKTPVFSPAPAPATVRPVHPVPEATDAPTIEAEPSRSTAMPAKPSARVLEAKPAQAVVIPSPQRLFSGFLVQAGVFSSAQRAEELHARLSLSGVPSTIESRVQVGPFRTRQEAEAAQAKLKELGIESVLLPPKGGKH